jgi:hypothetical protein
VRTGRDYWSADQHVLELERVGQVDRSGGGRGVIGEYDGVPGGQAGDDASGDDLGGALSASTSASMSVSMPPG